MEIVSNKAQPESFHFEIIGEAYDFAKDKPLKLLNGGHLLALLHKNGKEGYIDIQEAKDSLKS